jgi:hypothetical protein
LLPLIGFGLFSEKHFVEISCIPMLEFYLLPLSPQPLLLPFLRSQFVLCCLGLPLSLVFFTFERVNLFLHTLSIAISHRQFLPFFALSKTNVVL